MHRLFVFFILWAQKQPLRKENTFTLKSLSYAKDTLAIQYEIPFDGVIELRILGEKDSVLAFFQWPSIQGAKSKKIPIKNLPKGTIARFTYKGKNYTAPIR